MHAKIANLWMNDRMENKFSRLFWFILYIFSINVLDFVLSCLDHNEFKSRNEWMNL